MAAVIAYLRYERTKRPVTIVLLPANMLIVGGSIGFCGLFEIAEGNVTIGLSQFIQMFVVVIGAPKLKLNWTMPHFRKLVLPNA